MYDVRLTRQAVKDAIKVERSGLKPKAAKIIATVRTNPYEESHSFEMLKGDLKGAYSRRINRQHRFVYEILPNSENAKASDGRLFDGIIKIISMWTYYE